MEPVKRLVHLENKVFCLRILFLIFYIFDFQRMYSWAFFKKKLRVKRNLLQAGAGTIRPEIISSLITGGSEGGGGQTKLSIMSSVDLIMPGTTSRSSRSQEKR